MFNKESWKFNGKQILIFIALSGFFMVSIKIREVVPINCPLKVSNQNGQDGIDVVANTVFTQS